MRKISLATILMISLTNMVHGAPLNLDDNSNSDYIQAIAELNQLNVEDIKNTTHEDTWYNLPAGEVISNTTVTVGSNKFSGLVGLATLNNTEIKDNDEIRISLGRDNNGEIRTYFHLKTEIDGVVKFERTKLENRNLILDELDGQVIEYSEVDGVIYEQRVSKSAALGLDLVSNQGGTETIYQGHVPTALVKSQEIINNETITEAVDFATKGVVANSESVNKIVNYASKNNALIEKNTNAINFNGMMASISRSNITDNTDSIADNTNSIADNVTNITTNRNNIADNTNSIANNATNITTNRNNIADNTNNIADNVTNITTNRNNIADNTNSIETINSKFDDVFESVRDTKANTARIEKLEMDFSDLSADYYEFKETASKGIAGVAAMAQITAVDVEVGQYYVGAGIGGFNSKSAVAIGLGYRHSNSLSVKGAISFASGDAEPVWGAGATYTFK